MKRTYQTGMWGERAAVVYLMLKGYRILERRYKTYVGEVDIIAKRGKLLAMVEVKTRKGTEVEVLQPQQMKRIRDAASLFIAKKSDFANHSVRFDLIIVRPGRLPQHVQNAWQEAV